jgi:hypothetical protein
VNLTTDRAPEPPSQTWEAEVLARAVSLCNADEPHARRELPCALHRSEARRQLMDRWMGQDNRPATSSAESTEAPASGSGSAGHTVGASAAPEPSQTDGKVYWQLAVDLCRAAHDAPTVPCIAHKGRAYDQFLHGAPDPSR